MVSSCATITGGCIGKNELMECSGSKVPGFNIECCSEEWYEVVGFSFAYSLLTVVSDKDFVVPPLILGA